MQSAVQLTCLVLGEKVPNWIECRKVLGSKEFVDRLLSAPETTITAARVKTLKAFMETNKVSVAEAEKASPASGRLARWCVAVINYAEALKTVELQQKRRASASSPAPEDRAASPSDRAASPTTSSFKRGQSSPAPPTAASPAKEARETSEPPPALELPASSPRKASPLKAAVTARPKTASAGSPSRSADAQPATPSKGPRPLPQPKKRAGAAGAAASPRKKAAAPAAAAAAAPEEEEAEAVEAVGEEEGKADEEEGDTTPDEMEEPGAGDSASDD